MKNRQTIIAAAIQLSKVIAQAASIKIKERTPALAAFAMFALLGY